MRSVPVVATLVDPAELDRTLGVLADLTGLDLAVGQAPTGWSTVSALAEDGERLDGCLARVEDRSEVPKRAASLLSVASWWSWGLAVPLAAAVVTTGRAWHADPDLTWVRLHDDGWIEAVRVAPSTVVEVDDDRLPAVADDLVGLLEPVHRLVLTRGRVARRALWGSFADLVGWAAAAATRRGADPGRTHHVADGLLDAIAVRAGTSFARPTTQLVETALGELAYSIRGTCCLAYTCHHEPSADGDAYCNTCPFRSRASRAERLRAVALAEGDGDPTHESTQERDHA